MPFQLSEVAMKRKPTAVKAPLPNTAARPKPTVFNSLVLAVLAGVFVLGIGIGVVFSSTTNLNPENVASIQYIDQSAPDPQICINYGASATVMDTRVFVTYEPFSVYVSQPIMQPGCVLRKANWSILEQRKLVNSEQVRDCKQRLNTFGYTGKLENRPQISCVYQSDSDKNRFLNAPGSGSTAPESDNF